MTEDWIEVLVVSRHSVFGASDYLGTWTQTTPTWCVERWRCFPEAFPTKPDTLTEPFLNLTCPLWSVTTVHHFVFIPLASPSGQEHHPLLEGSTTKQQRPWFLKINIIVIKYRTSCLKSCRNNSRLCMLLSSPRDDSALLLTNGQAKGLGFWDHFIYLFLFIKKIFYIGV